MLLLWNSQQKTMNNSNIPGDNRGMQPLPPRSIIDRFPKPIQLNLIGTSYQKIGGEGNSLCCLYLDIGLSVLNRAYTV